MDLAIKLIDTGIVTHDDTNCFWTDSYYATPQEMEGIMHTYDFQIADHLATDGLSSFLSERIDAMSDEEYEVWCKYHYMVCREKSILGSSNHGLIIGQKI